jgi:hypothetical protein
MKVKVSIEIVFFVILAPLFAMAGSKKFTAGIQTNFVAISIMGNEDISNDPSRPYFVKAETVKANVLSFTATFGFKYPILKINEKLSIGINPNVGLGYMLSNKLMGLSGRWVYDFPEYLTISYDKSSDYTDLIYTLGIGYNYTFNVALPYQSPSIMAQITIGKLTIRMNYSLLKYKYYSFYTSEGDILTATIRPIGLQFIVPY